MMLGTRPLLDLSTGFPAVVRAQLELVACESKKAGGSITKQHVVCQKNHSACV